MLLLIICFIAIWFSTGVIIRQAEFLSNKLKINQFVVSFVVLGLATSITEFVIGANAIIDNKPSIFVGNLLGGVAVIFLFIIPMLAIFAKSLKLDRKFNGFLLIASLLVILAAPIFVVNREIQVEDSYILITSYIVLVILVISRNQSEKVKIVNKSKLFKDIVISVGKIFVVTVVMLFAGNYLVDTAIYYSNLWGVSPFIISILGLSVGSNLPEIVVGIRSILSGKKSIAFANYLGSAAANSLALGLLSLINFIKTSQPIIINSNLSVLWFIVFGLIIFYIFIRSKTEISRNEGFALLFIYAIFVGFEFVFGIFAN